MQVPEDNPEAMDQILNYLLTEKLPNKQSYFQIYRSPDDK